MKHANDNKCLTSLENGNARTSPTRDNSAIIGVGTSENAVLLPEAVLRKLYHSYSVKQRYSGLIWFLFTSILFDLWSLVIPQGQCIEILVVTSVVLCVNILLCLILGLSKILLLSWTSQSNLHALRNAFQFIPHVTWTIAVAHFVLYLGLQKTTTPRDLLGWAIVLNFLIYVTLPLPLFYAGIIIGVATIIIYLSALIGLTNHDPFFTQQVLSNMLLIIAAVCIGLLSYFIWEAKQKRAFLEAKKSLEVKMIIEEQSAEQERLLLSVLPKHVAVKMRQDLGCTSSEPFKKIYMSRHENVSILYADIVGFTAISSTYSAQDLVKMLNELFARFDRLAEKYNQLRIKILGDCYYCISGAPDEIPDHAVLCVHMGLSMVKAIKYVQQKTNSPVDMRVGIHTGAVLAGILGQRQWQFDVYSKDVELANKMESSGKAGRVHISNRTLAFLNGEFEVEPAHGERREEALRIAGLKTYFIKKVIKPFVSSTRSVNGSSLNDESSIIRAESQENEELSCSNINTPHEENQPANIDKEEDFKKRLHHELVAKDGHGNLSKDTNIFLKFKRKDLEQKYSGHREPYSSLPLLAAFLVQCVDILLSLLILPSTTLHTINTWTPLLPILILVLLSASESFPNHLPAVLVNVSKRFNDVIFLRELSAILIILIIGASNLIDIYFFAVFFKPGVNMISEDDMANSTEEHKILENVSAEFIVSDITFTKSAEFWYPSYTSNFAVLILLATAVIAQLTHMTKIILMGLLAGLHCFFNVWIIGDLYNFEDTLASNPKISTCYSVSSVLILTTVALSFLARHMDQEDRVIFKWKTEVAEQKEMATDMRRRNEALVYNVLPVHVAEHFMKNTKRSHDDLYSQSYSEVGVLFASMPNFSDFYSEESVNNQGLECLRFLNEVISDFDALLELPNFQDIIKIKTIGSTYMAASGINLARVSQPEDPIIKRWSHLDTLVEFALELKKALQGINEQSFNHFVLKMGINHGPITAGVIGARKPHYDIWGNTVNVASRMESTGKAGAIQVTEETCNILQQFGYTFQQRGLVSVKGKGQLMTYYLEGKAKNCSETKINYSNGTNHTETDAAELALHQKSDGNSLQQNGVTSDNLNKCSMESNKQNQEVYGELEIEDIKTPLLPANAVKENTIQQSDTSALI